MNRLLLIALALLGLAGVHGQWERPSDTAHVAPPASVVGRVTLASTPRQEPVPLSPYARRRPVPPQNPGVPGGVEDAFVYLEPLDGDAGLSPPEPTVVLQRDRTIIPHVSVAHVGQTVEFPNEDDVFHNLFSLSPGNQFSLGRYAPGVTERASFENPGVVRLFCDIHAEMAGVILVVATPWVTSVSSEGEYRFSDVPGGRYRAVAWHPAAGADSVTLEIDQSAALTQDFVLGARR